MSYRITVNESASPVALAQPSTTVGAMVIRASKGNDQPVLIPKGNEQLLTRLFGYPTATLPDIQEAIDYNKDSAIWVSAPNDATEALLGGVLVKTGGTEPLTDGVADLDLLNFSAVPYRESIGTGNGVLTNFTATLSGTYVNNSLFEVLVGGVAVTVSVTDAEPEVISGTGITSGTLTRATKAIDITFDTAPASGADIEVRYTSDESADTYFAIFSSSPHTNDEKVLVTYNADLEQFEWSFYISDYKGVDKKVADYVGSIDPNKFNASNTNIFMEDYLADVPYFTTKVNLNTYTTFTDDTALVSFAGGTRSLTFTSTEFTAGWLYFQQKRTYEANVFMDVTGDSAIPAIFDNLRKNHQTYQRYILILPDSEAASVSITTKAGYSIDNRGLSFYSNFAQRKEVYTNTKIWSPLIGLTGVKHAEIIRGAFGGLAPSWTNENGLGGQLSVSIEKMRYDYTEDELRSLDEAGINPRIFDQIYGVVITAQKTGQNPAVLTDFSYLNASGVADYIIQNVIKQVLTQQQTKLNDASHRAVVKSKADTIMGPTVGVGVVTDFFNKCDSDNNNADVLTRREFVLTSGVKITTTSEFIIYNFISTPQGVDVEVAAAGTA